MAFTEVVKRGSEYRLRIWDDSEGSWSWLPVAVFDDRREAEMASARLNRARDAGEITSMLRELHGPESGVSS
jgi:hypothetical protein